jgi:hypothetical protein
MTPPEHCCARSATTTAVHGLAHMALSIAKLGQAHIPGRITLGNHVPAHIQPLRARLRNVLPLMVPRQAIARGGQKALRFLLLPSLVIPWGFLLIVT